MSGHRPKAEKLIKRFYEVLALLKVLGQAQGDRIAGSRVDVDEENPPNDRQCRRDLLRHLCMVCDFKKGGSTVTAMALEEQPDGPTYWVASPGGSSSKIIPFLQETLEILYNVGTNPTDVALHRRIEGQLFEKFTSFCNKRLTETRKYLCQAVEREEKLVRSSEAHVWLQTCQQADMDNQDLLSFCEWAYSVRNSPENQSPPADSTDPKASCSVRHYIGRMTSTIRAAKVLVRLAPSLVDMFDNFQIKEVSCGEAVQGPSYDSLMTLDGIAKRMSSPNEPDKFAKLVDALHRLDRTSNLESGIKRCFEDPTFKLRTHAEVAVLEAVHHANIDFYDDDRYIACSKAACFCCYHYFCAHPGRFVRPSSSNNLWFNWQIPTLPEDAGDKAAVAQRNLLNKMIGEIRLVAYDRVVAQSGLKHDPHPDSSTGLTREMLLRQMIQA